MSERNLTKAEQGIINGGTFQIGVTEESWIQNEANLWINIIKGGSTYFFPSEIGMNITIGGQTYSILDYAKGTGSFSLASFNMADISWLLAGFTTTTLSAGFGLTAGAVSSTR